MSSEPPKSDSKLMDTSRETLVFDAKADDHEMCSMFFVKGDVNECVRYHELPGRVCFVSNYKLSNFDFSRNRNIICSFMKIQHHLPDKYKSVLGDGFLLQKCPVVNSFTKQTIMVFDSNVKLMVLEYD